MRGKTGFRCLGLANESHRRPQKVAVQKLPFPLPERTGRDSQYPSHHPHCHCSRLRQPLPIPSACPPPPPPWPEAVLPAPAHYQSRSVALRKRLRAGAELHTATSFLLLRKACCAVRNWPFTPEPDGLMPHEGPPLGSAPPWHFQFF